MHHAPNLISQCFALYSPQLATSHSLHYPQSGFNSTSRFFSFTYTNFSFDQYSYCNVQSKRWLNFLLIIYSGINEKDGLYKPNKFIHFYITAMVLQVWKVEEIQFFKWILLLKLKMKNYLHIKDQPKKHCINAKSIVQVQKVFIIRRNKSEVFVLLSFY